MKQILKKNYRPYKKWCCMINIMLKTKKTPQYVKKEKNTYCLVCKKKTDNKNIKGVVLENKTGPQKSMCVDCDSKKPTFLKLVKIKIVFTNYKSMDIYYKNCKTYWISHKNAKAKSKCTKCLTDRMFFDKINKCDLEQLVKHFFLYWCIL